MGEREDEGEGTRLGGGPRRLKGERRGKGPQCHTC